MKTALTIGFFDGVHRGHQKLLRRLRQEPHTTILTFSNHPKGFFHPPAPLNLLPLAQKLELLRMYADELFVWEFNAELAKISFSDLLDRFSLSILILGKGSVFGRNREGTEEAVTSYCQMRNIPVEYIEKELFDKEPISSSRIRKAIEEHNYFLASQLLGRPL